MEPPYSYSNETLLPECVFAEIKEWEAILNKNHDVLIKNQIFGQWDRMTDEERKKWIKKHEHIKTEQQLHEHLRKMKEQIYKNSKNKLELQRLSNIVVKRKKITKKNKKQ